jgi:hypothetical protein
MRPRQHQAFRVGAAVVTLGIGFAVTTSAPTSSAAVPTTFSLTDSTPLVVGTVSCATQLPFVTLSASAVYFVVQSPGQPATRFDAVVETGWWDSSYTVHLANVGNGGVDGWMFVQCDYPGVSQLAPSAEPVHIDQGIDVFGFEYGEELDWTSA